MKEFDSEAEIFLRAAELMREKGWTQGAYKMTEHMVECIEDRKRDNDEWAHLFIGPIGSMCEVGAISEATSQSIRWRKEADSLFETFLVANGIRFHLKFDSWMTKIINWNDENGRTAEDAIIALEQAAAYSKVKEEDK